MSSSKPKWYYGWYIVIAASVITLFTSGLRMSFGPFFNPILNDFQLSRTDLSIIVAIGMIVYGVAMPLAGYLESLWSAKKVLLIGSFFVLGSSLWMTVANSATELLLSFGIALSIGLAFTSQTPLTPVIARWFIKRRGQALFYLSTGSMTGIAIMNPVSNILIQNFTWQNTMLIFGITFFILIILVALFVLRENVPEGADESIAKTKVIKTTKIPIEEPAVQLRLIDSIKTLPFWQISIGLFACGYSMNLLGSHGVPMLIDHGFSSSIASGAIGFIGLVAIPGTLILGSLADKVPKKNMLALIYIARGIGFIFIVLVISTFQLYMVALIAGLAWAGNAALGSAILSDIYGVRQVGMLYGLALFIHQIGASISTILGGWAYETFHTHLISFGSAAILLLIVGVISLRIPQRLKSRAPVASEAVPVTK